MPDLLVTNGHSDSAQLRFLSHWGLFPLAPLLPRLQTSWPLQTGQSGHRVPGVPLAQPWPDTASGPLSSLAACPRLIGTGCRVLFSQCQLSSAGHANAVDVSWTGLHGASLWGSLGFSGGLVPCWVTSFEATTHPFPVSAYLGSPQKP